MSYIVSKVQNSARREQIVRAAFYILAAGEGINALTIGAIARETGVSTSDIYRHFKDNDEITEEMVTKVHLELMKNLTFLYESDPSPLISLKRFYLLHLDFLETRKGIARLAFSGGILKAGSASQRKIDYLLDTYSDCQVNVIEKGKKIGNIRKAVDSKSSAMVMIGMVQAITLKWLVSDFSFPLVDEGMMLWHGYEDYLTYDSNIVGRQK